MAVPEETLSTPHSYMKRKLNLDLSGNEVYYTACFLLVILKYSCSKLHRQKGFYLILFSYERAGAARGAVPTAAMALRGDASWAALLSRPKLFVEVVSPTSIPTQIRQLILHISNSKQEIDDFVEDLTVLN